MIQHLIAFGIMAAFDFVWARYTIAMAGHKAFEAAITAAVMPVFSALMAIAYVSNWTTMFSAALGAFVGTFISVKWAKK